MSEVPWEVVVLALAALAALAQRAWHVAKKRRAEAMFEAVSEPSGRGRYPAALAASDSTPGRQHPGPQDGGIEPLQGAQSEQKLEARAAPGGGSAGRTGVEDAGVLGSGSRLAERDERRTRPRRAGRRAARVLRRLRHRDNLRDAILAKEILDRPVSERQGTRSRTSMTSDRGHAPERQ